MIKGNDNKEIIKGNDKKESEAECFFYGFRNHFVDMSLENLRMFMQRLGNPQDKVKVIHITGTNGKGSVSSFIASILTEAGFKTGRYHSPAVFEKREIIAINGRQISEEEFAKMVELMKPVIKTADHEGRLPTVFELETALAYQYFAYNQCDFAVIECGMGGLTDATNITNATVLSVLTSISMDHMAWLGNTLEEIAKCKAGIIKRNIPVVVIEQDSQVMQAVSQVAKKQGSPVITVKKDNIKVLESTLKKQRFAYQSSLSLQEYEIQMSGRIQTENGAEAVEAVCELVRQGYIIEERAVKQGLLKSVLQGRFQVIQNKNPMIVIDGGHNPGAAFRLRENITLLLKGYHIIFIMGIFADKDYEKVVEITCDLADNIYTIKAEGKRALNAKTLAECIRVHKKEVCPSESISEALELAVSKAEELTAKTQRKSAIVCFGSFSFLKYIKEIVEDRRKQNEN